METVPCKMEIIIESSSLGYTSIKRYQRENIGKIIDKIPSIG